MKSLYIGIAVAILALIGIGVVFLLADSENPFQQEPIATSTDGKTTASTTKGVATATSGELSEQAREAIQQKLNNENEELAAATSGSKDVPDRVPTPPGEHCGVADTLPGSRDNAAIEELSCLGEAIKACEPAYITDNEQGMYLSVPEQESGGASCGVRLKFRHPHEVTTPQTLTTANAELVCPLNALEQFTQASGDHENIQFDDEADNASYTVRASLALMNARDDLYDTDTNTPAEDVLREQCSGNLVTQTASSSESES